VPRGWPGGERAILALSSMLHAIMSAIPAAAGRSRRSSSFVDTLFRLYLIRDPEAVRVCPRRAGRRRRCDVPPMISCRSPSNAMRTGRRHRRALDALGARGPADRVLGDRQEDHRRHVAVVDAGPARRIRKQLGVANQVQAEQRVDEARAPSASGQRRRVIALMSRVKLDDSARIAALATRPSSRHHSAIALSVFEQEVRSKWPAQRDSCAVLRFALERGRARLARHQVLLEIDVAREPPATDAEQRDRYDIRGTWVKSVLPIPRSPGSPRRSRTSARSLPRRTRSRQHRDARGGGAGRSRRHSVGATSKKTAA